MIPLLLPGADLTQLVIQSDAWPDAVHHLLRVRRVRAGEILHIGDGAGKRVQATVQSHDKQNIFLHNLHSLPDVAEPRVTLWLCCLEKTALEEAVHLACQVGLRAIRLVQSDFTVAPAPRDKETSRLEKIMLNSCIQSEQAWLPELSTTPVAYADLPVDASWFVALERHNGTKPQPVAHPQILIGPEGGWSPQEREKLLASTAQQLDLGSSILRAQTAALVGSWYVSHILA